MKQLNQQFNIFSSLVARHWASQPFLLHKETSRKFCIIYQYFFHLTRYPRGFIKGQAPGKLSSYECDFARLPNISKIFFKNWITIQGTIKNSYKLQSCPFLMSLLNCKPGVSISTDDWRNVSATLLREVSHLFLQKRSN